MCVCVYALLHTRCSVHCYVCMRLAVYVCAHMCVLMMFLMDATVFGIQGAYSDVYMHVRVCVLMYFRDAAVFGKQGTYGNVYIHVRVCVLMYVKDAAVLEIQGPYSDVYLCAYVWVCVYICVCVCCCTSGTPPYSKNKARMVTCIRELASTPSEYRPGFVHDPALLRPTTPVRVHVCVCVCVCVCACTYARVFVYTHINMCACARRTTHVFLSLLLLDLSG